MADATDNGWHSAPECRIVRRPQVCSAGIYPCANSVPIDSFELSPEPIAEFLRVYAGW